MSKTVVTFDIIEKSSDESDFSKEKHLLSKELLRKALLEFGIKAEELSYTYSEHGKPYLKDYNNLFFSISHSGKYVVCALSEYEIGIDIEKIDPIDLRIAERFFTQSEFEAIANESASMQYDAFYSFWTRKEAYVKCTGEGMSCAFNSFDVSNLPDYCFIELKDFPDYKCYICTKEELDNIKIIK